MWTAALSASSTVLRYVAEPAVRSIVLACFAAAAIIAVRVRIVSLRVTVWRGVLAAALAMPFLSLVSPPIRVPVPLPKIGLHTEAVAGPPAPHEFAPQARTALALPPASEPNGDLRSGPAVSSSAATRHSGPIPWALILAATYLAGAFLLLGRILAGTVMGAHIVRAANAIGDARAVEELAASTRHSGLKKQPFLGESGALAVPVTIGIKNPAILLPATWRNWDEDKLGAVLAHEVCHVTRRDALVQRLALIHRAAFWFSPLGWWLERHLADLAEQACDEAALASGAERSRYAETLLGFFSALEDSRSRVWWEGVSMANFGQAEKRVDRILAWRSAMPNRLKKSVLVGVVALAAPVVAFTASVHPQFFQFPELAQEPAVPQVPSAPSARPAVARGTMPQSPAATPEPAVAPLTPVAPASGTPAAAPAAPVGPSEQAAPGAPALPGQPSMGEAREALLRARKSVETASRRLAAAKAGSASRATEEQARAISKAIEAYKGAMEKYNSAIERYRAFADAQAAGGIDDGVPGGVSGGVLGGVTERYGDSGPRFVIVTKDSDSVIMSGSSEDEDHAKTLRSKISGNFIWFEKDEKPYVIRDQATVDRARKLWEPEQELGKKQEALGRQQEALGKQQEELGERMEQVRVKIPDLSAQMEKLEAEMKQLSAKGGTVEQIGDLQSQIGELQSRIGEIQSDAGRQQGEVGRQQGELGRKQGELGRQQGELGRQQGELARQASREMKKLLDDAVASGIAKPE